MKQTNPGRKNMKKQTTNPCMINVSNRKAEAHKGPATLRKDNEIREDLRKQDAVPGQNTPSMKTEENHGPTAPRGILLYHSYRPTLPTTMANQGGKKKSKERNKELRSELRTSTICFTQ